jgi:broad specificity phosphatase PhoE
MTCRISLISHGTTSAMRRAAFPLDEELEDGSAIEPVRSRSALLKASRAWTSPARRARQTAVALGLRCIEEVALRDLDCGSWAGRGLEEIQREDPAAIAAWRTDPKGAPHGGESIADFLRRVGVWLDREAADGGRIVAVTHAAVIRAGVVHAIDAPLTSFWHVDVAPLTVADLRHDGSRWTLRALGQPIS